jgi:hypothetical protein
MEGGNRIENEGGNRKWRSGNAPNATEKTLFWIVYVSVSSSFTRGSVSRGRSQYSRKEAAKSMVVSCASLLEAVKLIGGHVLLVGRPRDVLVLEQVDDSGYVGRDVVHVVVVHPEEVPADRCNV